MEWTSKTPEIPGWYWAHCGGQGLGMAEVRFVDSKDGRYMEVRGACLTPPDRCGPTTSGWHYLIKAEGLRWFGPVAVPEDPSIPKITVTHTGSWTMTGDDARRANAPGRQKRRSKGGA